MSWLAAALLVATVTTASSDESNTSENTSKELIKNLRRQLMRDNSDYSFETSEKREKIHMRASTEAALREISYTNNYYVTTSDNFRNKNQENVGVNEGNKRKKNKAEHLVSKKDLLYYIDNEISNGKNNRRYSSNSGTGVTYKMLKVRRQHRRAGQRRYVQEEGQEGVAIVSLDSGPLPELRLPRSRRQYRHDRGALAEEEEAPPPAVDTSDPDAAAQEGEHGLEPTTGSSPTEAAH